jgi:hypothetical protein
MAWKTVPTAADSDQQLMLASEVDGMDDVGSPRAARDQCRPAIERTVPSFACGFIPLLFRLEQLPAETGSQVIDIGRSQYDLVSGCADRNHFAHIAGGGQQSRPREGGDSQRSSRGTAE